MMAVMDCHERPTKRSLPSTHLSVVDMTNGTNVNMGFAPIKFLGKATGQIQDVAMMVAADAGCKGGSGSGGKSREHLSNEIVSVGDANAMLPETR